MTCRSFLVFAIAFALSSSACKKEEAQPAAPSKTPAPEESAADTKVVVTGSGGSDVVKVADKEIVDAVDKLMNDPAEQATAADKAKGVDAAKLLGTWNIVHTVMLTNGEGGPSKPIMPTTWTFDKAGGLAIKGGMAISMKYIYTGDKLIVTGMGPKQAYDVVRVTDKELEVRMTIAAGSTKIENTTLLRR